MVASTTQTEAPSGPATGPPPSPFDAMLERYGTLGLLKFLGALLAYCAVHLLLRMPALLVLRGSDGLVARISATPVAAGFPGHSNNNHAAYGGSAAA